MPERDLALLTDAAREAGRIAMRYWRRAPQAWEKPGLGPVTEADLAVNDMLPLWLFFSLLAIIMFCFGWSSANMNSLSMEPLGNVAGTAASVFGFIQTVGGALIGSYTGQHFDGTTVPTAMGYFITGALALICILIAEKGRLFGVGEQYSKPDSAPVMDAH